MAAEGGIMFAIFALAFALIVAPIWIVTLLYDLRRRLEDMERAVRGGVPRPPPAAPQPSADRLRDPAMSILPPTNRSARVREALRLAILPAALLLAFALAA